MTAEREIPIGDKRGLHLRVIRGFVEKAQAFESAILVECQTAKADGKSPLEMMLLKGSPGSTLRIRADGEDAETAVAALAEYITNPGPADGS